MKNRCLLLRGGHELARRALVEEMKGTGTLLLPIPPKSISVQHARLLSEKHVWRSHADPLPPVGDEFHLPVGSVELLNCPSEILITVTSEIWLECVIPVFIGHQASVGFWTTRQREERGGVHPCRNRRRRGDSARRVLRRHHQQIANGKANAETDQHQHCAARSFAPTSVSPGSLCLWFHEMFRRVTCKVSPRNPRNRCRPMYARGPRCQSSAPWPATSADAAHAD